VAVTTTTRTSTTTTTYVSLTTTTEPFSIDDKDFEGFPGDPTFDGNTSINATEKNKSGFEG